LRLPAAGLRQPGRHVAAGSNRARVLAECEEARRYHGRTLRRAVRIIRIPHTYLNVQPRSAGSPRRPNVTDNAAGDRRERAGALVAGAFSMGTGEYLSVTSQNELVHAEVALERRMLAQFRAIASLIGGHVTS
jgi:hypothetical protein